MTTSTREFRKSLQRNEVELSASGMRVKNTRLFLDASRATDLSFVSHAHSDHVARHKQVIATAETIRLLEHRLGKVPSALPVPYRQPFTLDGLRIELFAAGHVLGSAQVHVTHKGCEIAYTGDINLTPGLTAKPAETAFCDVLVIESTFGHPKYRFPPREEIYRAIVEFARRAVDDKSIPVFFSYSLGKSQEAMKLLSDSGFKLAAHPSIADICDIYSELGNPIEHRRFDGLAEVGEVLFIPTNLARSSVLEKLEAPKRTAVLTGWAADGGAKYRFGTDEAFPLSDHADFEQLVQYVRDTRAKKVFTVHGFTKELAACLRDRGIEAYPLLAPKQLELF